MVREESRDGQKYQDVANETKLKVLVQYLKGIKICLILQAKNTVAWMRVCGTTVSGIILPDTELWGFLCAHYNSPPLNPQRHCNGCCTAFRVMHGLSCSTGSLVIARHNKICDKLLYLAQRAFAPASVRAEPLIGQGHTRSEKEIRQGSDKD